MLRRTLLLLGLSVLLAGSSAVAESYALLIGIGPYPGPTPDLEAPPHDVGALRQELIGHWDFQAEKITTLLDAAATRDRILAELDRLAEITRPKDFVFVYYSGHGTSFYDRNLGAGLGMWTGALLPYDFGVDFPERLPAEQLAARLVVGRRDLRPRLEQLDRERRLFVVFDTCFSGATVRALRGRRSVRWVSVPTRSASTGDRAEDDDAIFAAGTAREPDYPYRRLIYLSAASRSEQAEEITTADLEEYPTVDGRPHGALTNALLEGLSGAANSDRDDRITYRELYDYVRDRVHQRHAQTPQFLFPGTPPGLVAEPVFGLARKIVPAEPAGLPGNRLRVRLDPELAHLRGRIAALPRVVVVESRADVRLAVGEDGRVALLHASGDLIAGGYDPRSPQDLLARVARQALVRDLIDLSYPRQRFNVHLDLPTHTGFLRRGEWLDVTISADRPAYLLLLNVDTTGAVNVVYPVREAEVRPTVAERQWYKVGPPLGTEYLKLFAFRSEPAGLRDWMNRKIEVTDRQFEELLRFLVRAGADGAETRLKVVTVEDVIRTTAAGWPPE